MNVNVRSSRISRIPLRIMEDPSSEPNAGPDPHRLVRGPRPFADLMSDATLPREW